MKHLNGFGKRYFSLAVIAMFSTLFKLCRNNINYLHHNVSHILKVPKTSPPNPTSF